MIGRNQYTPYLTPKHRITENVRISPDSGCWEWQGATNKQGYGTMQVMGKSWKAHRYSYTVFVGDIPTGKCVLHHCDNPSCCNPEHLYAGTHVDNVRDCIDRGRHVSHHGQRNGSAKLRDWEREEIRVLYATGLYSMKSLGDCYGVWPGTICKVVNK